jgi:hypothetical protein
MAKGISFFAELLRRRVVRVVLAYIAVIWLLSQGFSSLFPVFDLPDWPLQVFIIVGIVLTPLVGWLAWKYDFTPPQLTLDPKDVEHANPELSWAISHHDSRDAGYIMLKWKDGTGQPVEKRFFKAISIGREEKNDIQLFDERISRHHAVFWAEEGKWFVKDHSTNGTYLNHVRLTEPKELPVQCDLQFHPEGPMVNIYIDQPAATIVS